MTVPALTQICPQCSGEIAPTLLACPSCGALVYGSRLQHLAEDARQANGRGDVTAALAAWRQALQLLPPGSRQHQIVSAKVDELSRAATSGGSVAPPSHGSGSATGKAAAGLGGIALILWKLKFAAIFLLTKAKFLLLGLTKAGTLLSMLLSFGVYWAAWGWQFALGLVLSIYVHEMGHVIALRRLGFPASAPMFIPGLGAVIRLRQQVANPREDAVIGLAGPIYGLGAAVACLGIWLATGVTIFAALARVGAWINLFNLAPIWTLDGGRAFHALSRNQKWIAAAVIAATLFFAGDGMLWLLLILAGLRAVSDKPDSPGDRQSLLTYAVLVAVLGAMCRLPVPGFPR